jgi:hypothetical protein
MGTGNPIGSPGVDPRTSSLFQLASTGLKQIHASAAIDYTQPPSEPYPAVIPPPFYANAPE